MSTLAKSVNFDSSMMWVDMVDGRKLGVPLAYFPRLLAANPRQLSNYEISGGGSGLHWSELDEDISVEGLLAGMGDLTQTRQLAA
jgi:hypothetical protein